MQVAPLSGGLAVWWPDCLVAWLSGGPTVGWPGCLLAPLTGGPTVWWPGCLEDRFNAFIQTSTLQLCRSERHQ